MSWPFSPPEPQSLPRRSESLDDLVAKRAHVAVVVQGEPLALPARLVEATPHEVILELFQRPTEPLLVHITACVHHLGAEGEVAFLTRVTDQDGSRLVVERPVQLAALEQRRAFRIPLSERQIPMSLVVGGNLVRGWAVDLSPFGGAIHFEATPVVVTVGQPACLELCGHNVTVVVKCRVVRLTAVGCAVAFSPGPDGLPDASLRSLVLEAEQAWLQSREGRRGEGPAEHRHADGASGLETLVLVQHPAMVLFADAPEALPARFEALEADHIVLLLYRRLEGARSAKVWIRTLARGTSVSLITSVRATGSGEDPYRLIVERPDRPVSSESRRAFRVPVQSSERTVQVAGPSGTQPGWLTDLSRLGMGLTLTDVERAPELGDTVRVTVEGLAVRPATVVHVEGSHLGLSFVGAPGSDFESLLEELEARWRDDGSE